MKWVGLYAQKVIALHSLAKTAGTTTDELCARYDGIKLENGLDKGEMFRHALSASYEAKEVIYIYTVCNLPHQRDTRTPVQYATDLIIGWLSEDAILTALNNNGIFATPIGSDKDRNFLEKDSITHLADIETPTKIVEVVFDYTNHWLTHDKLDLRDNKKTHLEENGITLLGVAPRANKAFVISDYTDFTHGAIPAYGKTGWTLQGIKQHLQPINEAIALI
jgi:hypothetical protein